MDSRRKYRFPDDDTIDSNNKYYRPKWINMADSFATRNSSSSYMYPFRLNTAPSAVMNGYDKEELYDKAKPRKNGKMKNRMLIGFVVFMLLMILSIPLIIVFALNTGSMDYNESNNTSGLEDEVVAEMEVTLDGNFTAGLNDTSSEEYKSFTYDFCREMEQAVKSENSTINGSSVACEVTGVRQGSIIVFFRLFIIGRRLTSTRGTDFINVIVVRTLIISRSRGRFGRFILILTSIRVRRIRIRKITTTTSTTTTTTTTTAATTTTTTVPTTTTTAATTTTTTIPTTTTAAPTTTTAAATTTTTIPTTTTIDDTTTTTTPATTTTTTTPATTTTTTTLPTTTTTAVTTTTTTPTTTTTTEAETTTEGPAVTVEIEITVVDDFDAALNDIFSDKYKNFTNDFCGEIENAFTSFKSPVIGSSVTCTVINISEGSIVVLFRVYITNVRPTALTQTHFINVFIIHAEILPGGTNAKLGQFIIIISSINVKVITFGKITTTPVATTATTTTPSTTTTAATTTITSTTTTLPTTTTTTPTTTTTAATTTTTLPTTIPTTTTTAATTTTSTPTTTTTTEAETTTEGPAVTVEIEITVVDDFDAALNDIFSDKYKNFTNDFCGEIEDAFVSSKSPVMGSSVSCTVINISEGSIVVLFRVYITDVRPTALTQTHFVNVLIIHAEILPGGNNAKLGRFIIIISSINVKVITFGKITTTPAATTETETTTSTTTLPTSTITAVTTTTMLPTTTAATTTTITIPTTTTTTSKITTTEPETTNSQLQTTTTQPGFTSSTSTKSSTDDDVFTVMVEIEITIDQVITEGLTNVSSEEYKNFTDAFCKEIEEAFNAGNSKVGGSNAQCSVINIRNGSIIVFFRIYIFRVRRVNAVAQNFVDVIIVRTVIIVGGRGRFGPFILIITSIQIRRITFIKPTTTETSSTSTTEMKSTTIRAETITTPTITTIQPEPTTQQRTTTQSETSTQQRTTTQPETITQRRTSTQPQTTTSALTTTAVKATNTESETTITAITTPSTYETTGIRQSISPHETTVTETTRSHPDDTSTMGRLSTAAEPQNVSSEATSTVSMDISTTETTTYIECYFANGTHINSTIVGVTSTPGTVSNDTACTNGTVPCVGDARCDYYGGTCQKSTKDCKTPNAYTNNLCTKSDERCCGPEVTNKKCKAAGGTCQADNMPCNGGKYYSNLCPGAHRCCVKDGADFAKGEVSQKCLQCMCEQESYGCKPVDCKKDGETDSCGFFQIKQKYFIECGSPGVAKGETNQEVIKQAWIACSKDKFCSSMCVQSYMARYAHHSGCPYNCETYARVHNGGQAGCCENRAITTKHWNNVMKKNCDKNS